MRSCGSDRLQISTSTRRLGIRAVRFRHVSKFPCKLSMFRAVKLQQLGRPASGASVRLFLGSGGKRAKRGTGGEAMREWGVPHNPTRNIDRNRLAHAARWVDIMAL